MQIIDYLDNLDKKISWHIHHLKLPAFLQYYILIFGYVFNKEGPFILFLLISFVFPLFEEPQ